MSVIFTIRKEVASLCYLKELPVKRWNINNCPSVIFVINNLREFGLKYLLSTRVVFYREKRVSCYPIVAVSVTYLSRMELPLYHERRIPLLFAINKGVVS
jgi:hypothetical protein